MEQLWLWFEQNWDWNATITHGGRSRSSGHVTLGEGSLLTDMLGGSYVGGSLITDDQMLPRPNLRGYARILYQAWRATLVTVTRAGGRL